MKSTLFQQQINDRNLVIWGSGEGVGWESDPKHLGKLKVDSTCIILAPPTPLTKEGGQRHDRVGTCRCCTSVLNYLELRIGRKCRSQRVILSQQKYCQPEGTQVGVKRMVMCSLNSTRRPSSGSPEIRVNRE